MTDHLTPDRRRWNMSRIRARDTGPEKALRSMLHRLGYRFRLYRRDLPGTPDVVLPRYRTALFLHGCFWHRHPGCRYATTPGTRTAWWQAKFERTVQRDEAVRAALEAAGWRVVVIWECALRDPAALAARLAEALPRLADPPPDAPAAGLAAAEDKAPYTTPGRAGGRES